jgi:hypothetical protein
MAEDWKPITGLDELILPRPDPKPGRARRTAVSGAQSCAFCSCFLSHAFFRINGQMACPRCAEKASAGLTIESPASFPQGLAYGIAAALAGMALYATCMIVTHLYLGYVALAMGWVVGKAMMNGSNGAGGRPYQVVAVLLTYASISMAQIPVLIVAAAPASDVDWGDEMGRLAMWGIAAPFLDLTRGIEGLIGLAILLLGMRVAWKMTAAKHMHVDGPYPVKS